MEEGILRGDWGRRNMLLGRVGTAIWLKISSMGFEFIEATS